MYYEIVVSFILGITIASFFWAALWNLFFKPLTNSSDPAFTKQQKNYLVSRGYACYFFVNQESGATGWKLKSYESLKNEFFKDTCDDKNSCIEKGEE